MGAKIAKAFSVFVLSRQFVRSSFVFTNMNGKIINIMNKANRDFIFFDFVLNIVKIGRNVISMKLNVFSTSFSFVSGANMNLRKGKENSVSEIYTNGLLLARSGANIAKKKNIATHINPRIATLSFFNFRYISIRTEKSLILVKI